MAWNFFVYIYLNSLFYTWQVSSWSKYSFHNHFFPAPKLKKKEVNQDGHTTTGQRFCFCDLVSDSLKAGFVATSLSCYNCTSRICCLCCAVETEMGPLLLLFIMWQVAESLAFDWCCCCVCCCWMLGQLALLVLLLIAIATVCVDRFTSKHDWYCRCKWCTTSSRSSKSTPAKQKIKEKGKKGK